MKLFTILLTVLLLASVMVGQTLPNGPTPQCGGFDCGGHKKVAHFMGGVFIGSMAAITGHENWGIVAGFAVGVGKEIYDHRHSSETVGSSARDIVITTAGSAVPWAVVKLYKHYHKPKTSYYGGEPVTN